MQVEGFGSYEKEAFVNYCFRVRQGKSVQVQLRIERVRKGRLELLQI